MKNLSSACSRESCDTLRKVQKFETKRLGKKNESLVDAAKDQNLISNMTLWAATLTEKVRETKKVLYTEKVYNVGRIRSRAGWMD